MEQTLRLKRVLQRTKTVRDTDAPNRCGKHRPVRSDSGSQKATLLHAGKHKTIQIQSGEHTVSCPIVTWYHFHRCDIKSCKNHTTETKHCCLELDRKKPEGAKQFSDAELNLYKYKHRQISTRLVQVHRKNAVQSVKRILILHKFIVWISENFEPSGSPFTYVGMRKLEQRYPLRIRRLGWRNWMWEYVLDESIWARFTKVYEGECSGFNVHQLLGIKLERFESLIQLTKPERKYP